MVVSSTATKPMRAPASMAMLQRVMRPSIDRPDGAAAELDGVAVAACRADGADDGQSDVLGGDALAQRPSTATSMVFDFFCSRHWVASTCSTSEVPMPCARQAKAPWVEVCESPQTTVMPARSRRFRADDHVDDAHARDP